MRATEPLADRRLAVGAGDGDHRLAFARLAEDGVRERPAKGAQARAREVRHAPVGIPDEVAARFPEHGRGTARDGVGDEAPPVVQVARVGHEQVATTHLAAVVGDAGQLNAQVGEAPDYALRRDFASSGRHEIRLLSHSFPFPAGAFPAAPLCATWIGASCGTPSVRRAPPMTLEKIGPATSPP